MRGSTRQRPLYPDDWLAKNRHAKALAEQARLNGLTLTRTKKVTLHGKFVAWDNDDLIVTSLNWASASADPDFPSDVTAVQIQASGIATDALDHLEKIFPRTCGRCSAPRCQLKGSERYVRVVVADCPEEARRLYWNSGSRSKLADSA